MAKLINDLDLVPRIGRLGVDVNPCTRLEIVASGENFELGKPFTGDELAIWKDQFATLMAGPGSEERKIQLDRLEAYVAGTRAILQALNRPSFKGINAGDTEGGFSNIRPVFTIMGGGAGVAPLTWSVALTSTFAAWLYVSGTTGFTLGDSFGLVITHLMSLTTPTPFMAEIQVKTSRNDRLPVDVRAVRIADTLNGVAIIPIQTIIALPKSTLYVRARSDVTGTDEMAVRGLVVGLGRALKAEGASYPTT